MSLIVEFGLRKTKLSFRKLITTIIRNIKEDILSPLLFVKEILNTILTLLSKVFRLKKPFVWYNNTIIVLVSLFYILIFIAEIVAFNRINGFSTNDWLTLLKNGYNKVYAQYSTPFPIGQTFDNGNYVHIGSGICIGWDSGNTLGIIDDSPNTMIKAVEPAS